MIIEFSIPNGNMKICAEEFFENAGIRQIRKMLTLYQGQNPVTLSRRRSKPGWKTG